MESVNLGDTRHEKHQDDVANLRASDVDTLNNMGYSQVLQRSMSKFSNFSVSFSIICPIFMTFVPIRIYAAMMQRYYSYDYCVATMSDDEDVDTSFSSTAADKG